MEPAVDNGGAAPAPGLSVYRLVLLWVAIKQWHLLVENKRFAEEEGPEIFDEEEYADIMSFQFPFGCDRFNPQG